MSWYAFDDFELDAERLELRRKGSVVKADALVLRLLLALLRQGDRLVTKDALIDEVWEGRAVADNVLTVSMARLRKTLGYTRGSYEPVTTEYGRGYRFVRAVQTRAHEASDDRASIAAPLADPFVGRDETLARLRSALQRARSGRGSACVLLGEAGIGKTRVAEALQVEAVQAGFRVAWSQCREGSETPPLAPWLRVLSQISGITPARETARSLTADALWSALQQASAQAPWLIVLDDVHRADAASLELLSSVLDEIARARIVVLATLRVAQGARVPRADTHLPHALGHRNCERIELPRLRTQDVTAYVRALVDDPDEQLSRAVFEKSEGNPFFMAELTRPLPFAPDTDPNALEVPSTARDVMRQALAPLAPDTLALLRLAAVIGREFEIGLLASVAEREPSAIAPCVDEALTEGVLRAAVESRTAFAFRHDLLRAVLYDALEPSMRRRTHRATGEALQARRAAGEAIAPSELAFHFRAALPEGDPRKVVQYCREAAMDAASVFAGLDVVRYLRQALQALELTTAPSARLRMQTELAIALYARAKASREHARALNEAIRLARELGDAGTLVQAARMLVHLPGFRPAPGARAVLDHALSLLKGEKDDAELRATALATLACTPPGAFDGQRAAALVDEALVLARACGKPSALHTALRTQLYLNPDDDAARAELEQLAREHPAALPVLPAELAIRAAVRAAQHGDRVGVAHALQHAIEHCKALHGGELLWHCERMQAIERWNTGAFEESARLLTALHARARLQAITSTEVACAFDRVALAATRDEAMQLDRHDHSVLQPSAADPPSVWSAKARALALCGRDAEARAVLNTVRPSDLALLPHDSDSLGTLAHLARAAVCLQALDYAAVLHDLLAPQLERFAVQISFRVEGAVPQLLGELAVLLGRPDDALPLLERAIAMNARAQLLPCEVEARITLARLLRERDPRRAREAARAAQTLAVRLGLPRQAREAAALDV